MQQTGSRGTRAMREREHFASMLSCAIDCALNPARRSRGQLSPKRVGQIS
jgi:hypothetical protein